MHMNVQNSIKSAPYRVTAWFYYCSTLASIHVFFLKQLLYNKSNYDHKYNQVHKTIKAFPGNYVNYLNNIEGCVLLF